MRVHPSGASSWVVNYRAGNGVRKAPNKRVVRGRAAISANLYEDATDLPTIYMFILHKQFYNYAIFYY